MTSWSEIKGLKDKIRITSRQRLIIKENWERIIQMVGRKVPMDIISREIGVSERTIWRVLRELNLSTSQIVKAYEEMRETKEKKVLEKMEKIKAPPTSFEAFKQLPIINDFVKYCIGRRRISRSAISRYISVIYRICKEVMVHPEHLGKEVIEKYLDEMISNLGELIREESYAQAISNLISILRTWSAFRGFTITHKTVEYTGIWNVYFDLEDRRNLVKLAYEMYPKEIADYVVTLMEFYFMTGSRARAVTTIFDVKEQNDYVEIWVKEKGKKKQYIWKKIIPKNLWVRLKRYLPMSEKDLKRLRVYLIKLYARYFGVDDLLKKIRQSTLFGVRYVKVKKNGKYIEKTVETPLSSKVLEELQQKIGIEKARLCYYSIRHPLHIWRHTFAIEMLNFTGYNYEVTAVLGGWVKVNTLERIYGKLTIDKAFAIAFGRFEKKPFRFI